MDAANAAASIFQKGDRCMRKLMWFTIGFAAACFVGIYCGIGFWLALVASASAAFLFFIKFNYRNIVIAILVGMTVGSLWLFGYENLYLKTAKQWDGETVSATVIVSDYSYATDYGVAADGQLVLGDKSFRVRLYLEETEPLSPGDKIHGKFRLRATTPDSLQGSTYHQGEGVFLLAYVSDASVDYATETTVQFFSAVLKKKIISILDNTFPEDTLAFARALLLGDSSLLSYEDDTAFKLSGIRHVIAVSGLHVSILFSLVCIFSGRRRVLTALIGIPILFLFAAVAGFTPSVVRACIMQGLMILGLLFNKEYDPPTALSFAVLTMLCINPMTVTSVSFQLSVGCLVGIFLFYQRIRNYLVRRAGVAKGMSVKARLLRGICSSVSVTLSATIATTPLSAWYFGTVSLVGILTNLLTLWIVSFIFYGIMLVCFLGTVWPSAAVIVAKLVSWPVRYVLFVAKLMSDWVFSAVYTCSIYIIIWLVLCYLLFGVFLLSKRKRTGFLLLCMLTGLSAAMFLSWLEPQLDDYRVTVLDVGQGQSALIQFEGRNYLVDCGGDTDKGTADAVAETLLSQGITKLDGLILSHYDKDHAGGAALLLSRIKTKALYLPDIADDGGLRDHLQAQFPEQIIWVRECLVLSDKESDFTLFPAPDSDKGNESCLSVLFQRENCDILFTGDLGFSGEQTLMDHVDLPELNLLVVGHHGSANATGLPLLHKTKPNAAVISVGKDNYHGHPSADVLYRLRLFDCHIWRTDLDGTIIFRG